MKFTDGYWKVREDLSLYQAAEAVETETTEHSITVYASGRQSGGRKDLGGVTLTIQFFFADGRLYRCQNQSLSGAKGKTAAVL